MPSQSAADDARVLLSVMAVVLLGFLIVGIALPVLPLHIHDGLGCGTFAVGFVTGSQFATAVFTRVWAGRYSDRRGSKRTLLMGLCAAAASGLLYAASLVFIEAPQVSVTILLFGRAVLGGAESFIIIGAVSWGLGAVNSQMSAKVIAWVGMAMFAALALGGPVGTLLYELGGFQWIAMATAAVPLAALPIVLGLPVVTTSSPRGRPDLSSVVRSVGLPGVAAALSSIGFGAILAFGSLFFSQRGWMPVWLLFTTYAVGLIAARALLGHLPDAIGGAKVSVVSILVEAIGLVLIWIAPGPVFAAAGAMLTGVGYALVYPGLGAEALRRGPPESRGMVMGFYTVFLDVALGAGAPALGLFASWAGVGSVYLAAALCGLCATPIAALLLASGQPTATMPAQTAHDSA